MEDIKGTLKHFAVLFLLMAVNVLGSAEIIPNVYPYRNTSSIYLLLLSVLLIIHYSRIVVSRRGLKVLTQSITGMIFLLILLRAAKYSALVEVDVLSRYTWYLYYVPMLMIPTLLFYVSIQIFEVKDQILPRKGIAFLLISLAFILLILTNDLHQLVFRFKPDFLDWDSDYDYGWPFYAVQIWQYGLAIAAIMVCIVKCRIRGIRKSSWLLLIPMMVGGSIIIFLITGAMPKINGNYPIQIPEAYCFMAVGVLDCCLQVGLIPSNVEHRQLFKVSSLAAQITDQDGKAVYQSDQVEAIGREQFFQEDGSRIGEHLILRKVKIPGGYGLWKEDVEELDELNEELQTTENRLSEELELIRFQNELKEKQAKIIQRTRLYDEIARKTYNQSRIISELAKDLQKTKDQKQRERGRNQIILYSTYIKRYANLMLLSQDSQVISAGELALSMTELLRKLNRFRIPGEVLNSGEETIQAAAALFLFESLEKLLESNLTAVKGVLVNLSCFDRQIQCRINLEGVEKKADRELMERASALGVHPEYEYEDEIAYYSFIIEREGDQR